MNTELLMTIYNSSMKAAVIVLLNLFINFFFNKKHKFSILRYTLLFIVAFFGFIYVANSANAASFSNKQLFETHCLRSSKNHIPEYPILDVCPKCKVAQRGCPTCDKCDQCHRCYMCKSQKLKCHDCKHQNSHKNCHLCRCKKCVDDKKERKNVKEDEKRKQKHQPNEQPENNEFFQNSVTNSIHPLSPENRYLKSYSSEYSLIIEKDKHALDTEEEIEMFLHTLGITVSYEYSSNRDWNDQIAASRFQIWAPTQKSKKLLLSHKTQDEMREDMIYYRNLGELYFNTAVDRLSKLPAISGKELAAMNITAWAAVFAAGPDPKYKVVAYFSSIVGVYLNNRVDDLSEIAEMLQKSFDLNIDADGLEELLDRCNLTI